MKKKIIIIGLFIMFCFVVFKGAEHTTNIMNNCMQEHSYNYCKGLYE